MSGVPQCTLMHRRCRCSRRHVAKMQVTRSGRGGTVGAKTTPHMGKPGEAKQTPRRPPYSDTVKYWVGFCPMAPVVWGEGEGCA